MSGHQPRKPALPVAEYTVGWISALPIEAAAAGEILDEEHEAPASDPNDPTSYTLGRICGHAIVIGCLPAGRIDTTSAAVIATRMVARFPSIRIGLMVGIGGGNPSQEDIRLGDVVVSQPQGRYGGVVQYNMGKETLDGFEETGHLNAPPEALLSALFQAQTNYLRGRGRHMDYLAELEKKNPRFGRSKAGPDTLYRLASSSAADVSQQDTGQIVERDSREPDELVRVTTVPLPRTTKLLRTQLFATTCLDAWVGFFALKCKRLA